jgi:hypothetical protein
MPSAGVPSSARTSSRWMVTHSCSRRGSSIVSNTTSGAASMSTLTITSLTPRPYNEFA